jgi:cell wall-associated NlpC family hydrolase
MQELHTQSVMSFPGLYVYLITAVLISGCGSAESKEYSSSTGLHEPVTEQADKTIQPGKVKPEVLVTYAKTLLGTPYLYGSTDPAEGFDCSGFITHVFNHFDIKVPRSSIDFTFVGTGVLLKNAKPGDLILFTGTDATIRQVGHMGIITSNIDGAIQFIHSTSGKAKSVVITSLENYYNRRFVKVIRVFPESRKAIRKANRQ